MCVCVYSNPKCAAELDGWNLEFDQNLVSYSARVLPTETIMQADGSKVSKGMGERGRKGRRSLVGPMAL